MSTVQAPKPHHTHPRRSVHRALLARIPPKGQSPWQLSHSHSLPTLGDHQVLIKTSYVALNPFDWQGVASKYGIGEEAKVMGRDGAGEIVGVGSEVKVFKPGDRVWFCANSSASHTGAFQEYSVHAASEVGHTPDHLADEEAATLGTGLITAGVALFKTLGIPLDSLSVTQKKERKSDAPWMLIWGGSGITGVYLIELATILGYRIICSASPVNHEYIKSLGADVVLDRWSDPVELVDKIREETDDHVKIAIDNVGSTTATLCHQVLQGSSAWRKKWGLTPVTDEEAPSRLVPLAGSPKEALDSTDSVRKVDTLRISFSTTFYGHPEYSEALLHRFDQLLQNKLLTPARIRLVEGGLYGIEKGLEDLRHGRVQGGYKLVARLADTPDQPVVGVKRGREPEIEVKEEVSTKRSRNIDEEKTLRTSKQTKDDEQTDTRHNQITTTSRSVIAA
ncbi:hypothetical protein I302_104673 [Kwoniella bestiolae CBS 10118]|uniref:Enoyl reductase (ER) domain-containing protein n=1 Tax=Kwoniella bestiolae CBS 10118 TaxID=1296100 RepID=A0A1B9FS26_9TREE|nr:hypothetical protein I302_09258 [Kwoniella bestiolae CBS 10118]OCF21579.1 hypothetical protein I302_09258 [Kwoniella bestiolae CBS 10118]